MARKRQHVITNAADLMARDAALDREICGIDLPEERETRLTDEGAHDPTPSYYFVLEELFAHFGFGARTQLLDVGCGTGRVLAYFLWRGFAGHATGVELDPELAQVAASWISGHDNLSVIQGSALDLDLNRYTDFYLFNPFSPGILYRFIESIEEQVDHPITLAHMSDNGDTWHYVGRGGWTELASGSIQNYRNDRGYPFRAYENPQHYTIWRYEP